MREDGAIGRINVTVRYCFTTAQVRTVIRVLCCFTFCIGLLRLSPHDMQHRYETCIAHHYSILANPTTPESDIDSILRRAAIHGIQVLVLSRDRFLDVNIGATLHLLFRDRDGQYLFHQFGWPIEIGEISTFDSKATRRRRQPDNR